MVTLSQRAGNISIPSHPRNRLFFWNLAYGITPLPPGRPISWNVKTWWPRTLSGQNHDLEPWQPDRIYWSNFDKQSDLMDHSIRGHKNFMDESLHWVLCSFWSTSSVSNCLQPPNKPFVELLDPSPCQRLLPLHHLSLYCLHKTWSILPIFTLASFQ